MKSQARGWLSWPPRLAASLLLARSFPPGPRRPSRGLHAVGTLITSGPSAATRDPPLGIPSPSRQLYCVFWKPWPPAGSATHPQALSWARSAWAQGDLSPSCVGHFLAHLPPSPYWTPPARPLRCVDSCLVFIEGGYRGTRRSDSESGPFGTNATAVLVSIRFSMKAVLVWHIIGTQQIVVELINE